MKHQTLKRFVMLILLFLSLVSCSSNKKVNLAHSSSRFVNRKIATTEMNQEFVPIPKGIFLRYKY